jgi:hypothetical protein
MHIKHRVALGIGVPVLLGSALAAGVAALPAHAQTYTDTALSAGPVTAQTYGGSNLLATNDTTHTVILLTGTGVTTWSLHGAQTTGVSISPTSGGAATISYTGPPVASPPEIVADATDSAGNAEALEIPVTIAATNTIQKAAQPAVVAVFVSGLTDANTAGTVTFSAVSSESNTITIGESNLPTGLTSGNPLTYVGGTAAPGTYGGVKVTATDADGAVLNGAFVLTVSANVVTVSNYGDMVNPFGNGFDTFRQHDRPGAIVAGWTATQHDPATHFLRNAGTHSGAFQFEYAPNGGGTGLCISDPGGGWSSDPLRDGLILTPCNNGPWQQFVPQSDGSLVNLATGLTIQPAGKGNQLRGGSGPVSWGGSVYSWVPFSSLPG